MSKDTLEDLRDPDYYARIPEALIYDKEAPHTAIRLYAVLDRHLNKKTKDSYPGYKRIKTLTGMSQTTISKALDYLQKGRFLNIIREHHGANRYQLMEVKLVQKMDKPVTENGQALVQKMDTNNRSLIKVNDPENNTPPKPGGFGIKEFSDWWMEAYQTEFGIKYQHRGGVDTKAIQRLIAGGLSFDVIKAKAKTAWSPASDLWTLKMSRDIVGFVSIINRIPTEKKIEGSDKIKYAH